jgi:hypothetical protein
VANVALASGRSRLDFDAWGDESYTDSLSALALILASAERVSS